MPLDTGRLTESEHSVESAEPVPAPEDFPPSLASGSDLGQALRAVREFKGLTLEDVAEATRVRRAYLDAVEGMRLEALPSRPFTVGYIRAYANELGLDAEAAVARFRAERPDPDTALREPVGVQSGRDPRLALVGVAGAAIIAAIFTWNVAQRAFSSDDPGPAPVTAKAPVTPPRAPNAAPSAVALGAPLPPPVESTTPPPYETPGLKEAVIAEAAAASAAAGTPPPAVEPPPPPAQPTLATVFKPQGKVYGAAPADASGVVLQALRPAAIMVRSPDGRVHFARYLSAGEAYRVPATAGLTVDVPETNAFQVFAAGASKGVLPTGVTNVSKLAPPVPRVAAAPAAAASAPRTAAASTPRPAGAAPAAVAASTLRPAPVVPAAAPRPPPAPQVSPAAPTALAAPAAETPASAIAPER
jgi:cytoskeletal protein RodZ